MKDETEERLKDVIRRWAPYENEKLEIKMMRALLCLAAYEDDCKRIREGRRPIRKTYPMPLPE